MTNGAFFGLRTDPFGLPFGLRTDPFGLQTDPFGLRTDPFGLRTDPFGLRTGRLGGRRAGRADMQLIARLPFDFFKQLIACNSELANYLLLDLFVINCIVQF